MAYIPYSPEVGAKYTLTGPDGTIAVFNDQSDTNFCGVLSDITGLDSADVRESADDLVQTDGGWHGDFWYGRRPITISGTAYGYADSDSRTLILDKIRRASNAMRADAVLSWLNSTSNAVQMQTWVRRQQPTRFAGPWVKTFQMLLVSQYAPLYSSALHALSGTSVSPENKGDYPSAPIIRVPGGANPTITNTTTGAVLKFTGTIPSTYIDVDILNHTAVTNGGLSANSLIDFINTTWPTVNKGINTFTTTGAAITVTWRDAWT